MRRPTELLLAATAGAFLVVAVQFALPLIARALYERDFQSAYVDCALAQQQASHFESVPLQTRLRVEFQRSLEVEQLRCLDYAALKLHLRGLRVSEETIASMEIDALANDPELRCDARCINLLQ